MHARSAPPSHPLVPRVRALPVSSVRALSVFLCLSLSLSLNLPDRAAVELQRACVKCRRKRPELITGTGGAVQDIFIYLDTGGSDDG